MIEYDLPTILKTIGLIGITLVVFAETGLLLGIFFPGDSLLITAGILASQGVFPITALCVLTFSAAIIGNVIGYAFGFVAGPKIFTRTNSFFLKKEYLERTGSFFEKHGKRSVFFARFIPIIRTITPLFAGVGRMPLQPFLFWTITGAGAWALGLPLFGYFLGSRIPSIETYLLPLVLVIIFLSFLPPIISTIPKKRKKEVASPSLGSE